MLRTHRHIDHFQTLLTKRLHQTGSQLIITIALAKLSLVVASECVQISIGFYRAWCRQNYLL